MKEEINLQESVLKNRWGRNQKVKPGDKVRLAPFKSKRSENELLWQEVFLSMMTAGLKAHELYRVKRIVQFPDDGIVTLYLDLGDGKEDGYYADCLQAVDERKIKAVEFPLSDPDDAVKYIKTITDKECYIADCKCRAEDKITEETHLSNEWIVLPATHGRCQVTMEGELREVALNPKKVIVIPVPAGKSHSLYPMSGFSSYTVVSEVMN